MTKQGILLSKRLHCITDCVRALSARYQRPPRLLDVGCDHGLVPAELIGTGDIESAVASDVREGPLQAARKNAERYGVADRIRFVCADGLSGVAKDAAEICVIAGMGGTLIRDILQKADLRKTGIQYLVLSPHTKADVLRGYLRDAGFTLLSESMTEEGGKFYPVLTVSVSPSADRERGPEENKNDCYEICLRSVAASSGVNRKDALRVAMQFGPVLLAKRDGVLYRYLCRQQARVNGILETMPKESAGSRVVRRKARDVLAALSVYETDKR